MAKIDVKQTIGILANLGVIAGIVFLGLELHQNNQLLENQARFVLMDNQVSGYMREIENPDLVERRLKANTGEVLTERDQALLLADVLISFTKWEWEYEQFLSGFIDEIPVEGYKERVRQYPFYFDAFEANKHSFNADWVAFMERDVLSQVSRE